MAIPEGFTGNQGQVQTIGTSRLVGRNYGAKGQEGGGKWESGLEKFKGKEM